MDLLKLTHKRSDLLGVFSSSLCLVHCLVTPLIFIVQAEVQSCCNGWQIWWKVMSFTFITLSFFAVYFSTKNTSRKIIRPFFWAFWGVLLFTTLSEEISWFEIPEIISYSAAVSLILIHFYSMKYCQCEDDDCCPKGT